MSLWGIGSHSREQLRGVIKGQKHTFNRWALAERRGREYYGLHRNKEMD